MLGLRLLAASFQIGGLLIRALLFGVCSRAQKFGNSNVVPFVVCIGFLVGISVLEPKGSTYIGGYRCKESPLWLCCGFCWSRADVLELQQGAAFGEFLEGAGDLKVRD